MQNSYQDTATTVRKLVLEMIYKGQSCHIGSNFSAVDFLSVLHKKKKPEDLIIYSKGWIAATAYVFLFLEGLLTKRQLSSYCKPNSHLIGLLEPIKGIPCAGGSMGYGLPFGVGFALSNKILKKESQIYVIMSDGEMQTGTTWESASIASHHNLSNLTIILDDNKLQAMGRTHEILAIEPLTKKWNAFGWNSYEILGHDFREIEMALDFQSPNGKPKIIIAHTVKGKGVKLFEDNNLYHYKNLNKTEHDQALKEL